MSVALAMPVGGADPIGGGFADAICSARPYVDQVAVWANGPQAGDVLALLDELGREPGAPIIAERGEWADDFGAARSSAFALTSTEWVLDMSADDRLIGGHRLRQVVNAAERAGADIAWCRWDHHDLDRYGWWPRLVRAGTGEWVGVIYEQWFRPGIDHWRLGVGQPGSIYAHPAHMHVRHTRRAPTPGEYRALLEKAAHDLERTPWALVSLAAELADSGDDRRVVDLLERHLEGRYVESELNAFHARALEGLAKAYERLGDTESAQRYAEGWHAYVLRMRVEMEHDPQALAFLLALQDEPTVKRWAKTPPHKAPLTLGPNDPAVERMAWPIRR